MARVLRFREQAMRCSMSMKSRRTVVQVTLPSGPPTQELLAEMTLDLGLAVTLLHGRITERETRMTLELAGDPCRVREGATICRARSSGSPFLTRAS